MENLNYSELIASGLYQSKIALDHKTDKTKSKYNDSQLFFDFGNHSFRLSLKFRAFVDKGSVVQTSVDKVLRQGQSVRWQIPIGKFLSNGFVRDEVLGQMLSVGEGGEFILKGQRARVTQFPRNDFPPLMFSWANKIYMMVQSDADYSISPVLWVSPFRFPDELPRTGDDLVFVGRLSKDIKITTATDGWITSSITFHESGEPV